MANMNQAFLLLGGNLGNRKTNLTKAREMIKKQCGIISNLSSLYETAAWGKTDQPAFLNQAIEIKTLLDAKQLMKCVLQIENDMGRKRTEKYGPRIIDIDILFFNDEKYNDDFLKIPHPELPNRRFALIPLEEIAPGFKHPVLKRSVSQLLKESPDKLEVKKYP
jgi:2-amino-4-hydroxy-6-hydroxymethyldihydropteridine diphosphokinase